MGCGGGGGGSCDGCGGGGGGSCDGCGGGCGCVQWIYYFIIINILFNCSRYFILL